MKWRTVRFEEVASPEKGAIVSGPFGSNIGRRFFVDEGVPVIRGNNLTFGERRFVDDGFVFVSDEKAAEFKNCIAVTGDLVFTAAGTIGQVGIIPPQTRFDRYIISNKQLRVRCDQTKVSSSFLFLWFTTNYMRQYLINQNRGCSVPLINLSTLRNLPIPLPPLKTQRTIAATIFAYDDLIENNRRRMALLEESARQLYQEWFVRLRFPGHEHTRIIDGVPEGWGRTQLLNLIEIRHGYAFQGSYFSENPTPRVLMTPGNFAIGGGLLDKLKYYAEEAPLEATYVLQPMDLVLTMTDLSKDSDTLGYPAMVPRIDGQEFLHNQRIAKVVPKTDFFPLFFLYCLFCDGPYRHHVVGSASGTSVKHTSPGRILAYSVAIPTDGKLVKAFDGLIEPFFRQINCLIGTNQKLRTARDLLLPRLMNGEVAV